MPLYEFVCEECNEVVEVIQKFDDEPPVHCDKPMKRNMSGGHIALDFKGNGFYKTDYATKTKDKK